MIMSKDKVEQKLAEDAKTVEALLANGDFIDEDGYPTEDTLRIIELWPFDNSKGWFEFIRDNWHLAHWGWREQEAIDEITNDKNWCYYVSTGGWSGNESIIGAMQKNWVLWNVCWAQSRRGGHYIFEDRK